ncbi:MAG: PorV/PorQ family protein [Bacteroidetes bacterium]|nr:PorV/PorQ family protein [Bacteroidota bacterium]MCW5896236.1 PorV/PorQ family protein [Bacteroidota bacterium]
MKRLLVHIVLLSVFVSHGVAQLVPNLGGQRAGISAFQFLKIGVGARGVAMGESFVAVANDASALFWNPAGLVDAQQHQVIASHAEYLVDIRHEFLGISYRLGENDAVGVSFSSLHMKDMEITTELQPFGTGRYFSFGDIAIGLTYSKKMTEQFSFGATVRYVEETLDILKMRSVMVDLGTLYWTGLGSTRFAVTISNFGSDVEPKGNLTQASGVSVSSFQSFSLPTIFKLGVAMEAMETEDSRLTTSLQLNHPNDNSEHFRLGLEYAFKNTLYLRGGVKRTIGQRLFGQDETSPEDFTFGAGFAVDLAGLTRVNADYAFARFGDLGSVHRISIAFTY